MYLHDLTCWCCCLYTLYSVHVSPENTHKPLVQGFWCFNPLPTNDAPMRHDLSELSISLWEFIWGGLILDAILQYMVSAYFSCFLWSVKG